MMEKTRVWGRAPSGETFTPQQLDCAGMIVNLCVTRTGSYSDDYSPATAAGLHIFDGVINALNEDSSDNRGVIRFWEDIEAIVAESFPDYLGQVVGSVSHAIEHSKSASVAVQSTNMEQA